MKEACEQAHGQFSAPYHWVNKTPEGDVQGICATWLATMPLAFQTGTVSALRDFLTPAQIIHLLAYKDALDQCFAPPTSTQLCIGHISVAVAAKRQGVASQLILNAIQQAQNLSLHTLVLDVDTENLSAIACYQKAGFTAQETHYFEATKQHFSRMVMPIA